jgi:hypothetical protein
MRIKAALVLLTLLQAVNLPLAAEPVPPADRAHCQARLSQSCPATERARIQMPRVVIIAPSPALGDILGGRGPEPHVRELRELALAAAMTGQGGPARIAARRSYKFGLTREKLQEIVDGNRLHDSHMRAPSPRLLHMPRDLPEVEPGWEHSQ